MPTVNKPTAFQGPPKATSKYSNKDGTKYISVPKSSTTTPPTQPSPTTASISSKGTDALATASASDNVPAPTVNRKKQKRRAKAAAKAAAEQASATGDEPAASNGVPRPNEVRKGNSAPGSHLDDPTVPDTMDDARNGEEWEEETESEDGSRPYESHLDQGSHTNGTGAKSKKSRKKKKNKSSEQRNESPPAPVSSGISREKIWNTSGPEERERIKQFWLGLGEDERKSLVKVEKDAVLKKMKEQQKHTCSCSVCGRKRTAIEEELEGLYDAYYEELESFANHPHNHPNGPSMFGGPKRFGPLTGLHPPGALPTRYSNHHPSRGRIVEHVDNDEDEDDEEDDEDEDEVYSEDEEDDLEDDDEEDEPEEIPRNSYQNEFFTFGQSLTVKGGILTVADDLLKNDGKKFIEMMEQLAERRMAREEDAKDHYAGYGHNVNGGNLPPPHNHPPPDEEEYDEDEEEPDDDYGSQDYDDEDEEEDTMTEEQRMEEGRRMFQIFAARMFEQRVLTAYREKVAKERQEKLLEELAAEDLRESQKAAKKAKDAQKRKDKAAQKKQAQLEEKARKEAAKAAEDAAKRAEEAERIEEAKRKAEDKKRKKEAQKKAEEEDRLRKEADRQRRVIEQKERQAEQERKAREAKEREKQAKEERQRKEQEARELKERETRERREKHEKDKREKEQRAAQAKADRDAKEKQKQEDKASLKNSGSAAPASAQSAKKQLPVSVPAIPHHTAAAVASPQISVATPILSKATAPVKPRTVSQEVPRSGSQTSQTGSGTLSNTPPPPTPLSTPGHNGPSGKTPPSASGLGGHPPHPRTMTPLGMKSPPGLAQSPYNMGMPPASSQFPPGMHPPGPAFGQGIFGPIAGGFRPGALPPPGLGGQMGGRPFPMPQAPPGFHHADPLAGMHPGFGPLDKLAQGQPATHSRQTSVSFEAGHDGAIGTPVQPIARPAPIRRPIPSQNQQHADMSADVDDMSNHLGSSALLDDTFDEPFQNPGSMGRNTAAPGARPFVGGPFADPVFGTSPMNGGWGMPLNNAFSPPPGFGSAAWPPAGPAFGGPPPGMRPAQPRSITIRQLLAQSCKELQNHAADSQGWIDLPAVKGHVDSIAAEPIAESELLDMCETEGNAQNGGGIFDVKHADNGKVYIKYDPDLGPGPSPFARNIGAPGEIGSPIIGHSAAFGSRF